MMRAKRPRAQHGVSQSHGNGHGGHSRTRSMSDDMGDDHLLHMDPSLMTERQQLAFLLRKTAQEHSGGDSPATHSSDNSSDDDAEMRRPKKRIQHAKTSPRNARRPGANAQGKPSAPTPRSRPAKSAVKPTIDHDAAAPTHKTSPRGHARPTKLQVKRLHVKTTSSPTALDAEAFSPAAAASVVLDLDANASIRKPSPSSTSDIAHISVFNDGLGHADFWSLHCALCSASTSQLDACSEPLFLCQSCDKKYPTQRTLGRV